MRSYKIGTIKMLNGKGKSWKQNIKFNHTPKNQQNFVHFFALASKKWLEQKINAFDDLN